MKHARLICVLIAGLVLLPLVAACGGAGDLPALWAPGNEAQPKVDDTRILGGAVAPRGSFGSTVRMVEISRKGEREWCGGTLIAPTWVVTAAHCVIDDDGTQFWKERFNVFVGPGNEEEGKGTRLEVIDIIAHPQYFSYSNDVALLELKSPAFAPSVQLFDPLSDAQLLKPGSNTFVAGWGRTSGLPGENKGSEKLLFTKLPFVSDADCAAAYNERAPRSAKRLDPALMLCAGGELNVDSCHGDSGGPLLVRHGQQSPWVLAGIVSWGPIFEQTECGTPGIPGAYTEIAVFGDFIWGEIQKKAQTTKPALPEKVRAGKVTKEALEIRWDDTSINETHFILGASVSRSEEWQYFTAPANASSKSFKYDGATRYWFTIQSCNAAGCSPMSKMLEVSAD